MSKKSYLLILFLSFNISFLNSCKKDDDSEEDTVPKRDLAEQYIAENDSIIEFMQTHFYNYTDFENIGSNQNPELIIDTIAGDNADKTPIFEQVKSIDIEVKDDDQSEKDAIIQFFETIDVIRPTIIGGYNSAHFDWDWLFERAQILGVDTTKFKTLNPNEGYKLKQGILKLGAEVEDYNQIKTIVILLNEDFEGGEFEVKDTKPLNLKTGDCVMIPSLVSHRVKPITSGIRYSLTMWHK